MRLDEVSTGSIYVDTNVLYMYLRADPSHLETIKAFFTQVVDGRLDVFVSVVALDELYYRLLLGRIKDTASGNPLDVLRDDLAGAIDQHGNLISTAIRKLVSIPHFNLVGIEAEDSEKMLENIQAYSLLPRDALHLAIIQRLGIRMIASDDRDFDRVESINRHWVINPCNS